MKTYYYLTVSLSTFFALTQPARPQTQPDAYVSDDEETRALRQALDNGYRLIKMSSEEQKAVFEKKI